MSTPARDIVFVRGLRVDTLIGVHAWERTLRQTLLVDLELQVDARAAAAQDALSDALDYAAVSERVRAIAGASEFRLVESLAETLAGQLLEEFALAWLRIRIVKPGAVPGADAVGVLIERTR